MDEWNSSGYLHIETMARPWQVDYYMGIPGTSVIDDLPDSRLGTLSYWDDLYKIEAQNLEDHGDEGEVWFGVAAERRVVDWICKNIKETKSVMVDVGCGNGHFCLALAKKGYRNIYGLDYSESAVQFATSLSQKEEISTVQYFIADLLNPGSLKCLEAEVVIDKGTFDAISLGAIDNIPGGFSSKTSFFAHKYAQSLRSLCRKSHHFIITSCNWTEQELVGIFGEVGYELVDRISHPSFAFGGSVGNTVCTVIFTSVL
jgi:SAM-dependent methyltransferase